MPKSGSFGVPKPPKADRPDRAAAADWNVREVVRLGRLDLRLLGELLGQDVRIRLRRVAQHREPARQPAQPLDRRAAAQSEQRALSLHGRRAGFESHEHFARHVVQPAGTRVEQRFSASRCQLKRADGNRRGLLKRRQAKDDRKNDGMAMNRGGMAQRSLYVMYEMRRCDKRQV